MIIDMHAHAFPERIAERAVTGLREKCHTRSFEEGTEAGLRASSRAAGIDLTVVLPVATSARQVAHINDSAIRTHETQVREHTGIDSFGGAHPDDPEWRSELKRLADAGIRGIKIHPPYQEVDLDDPRFLRILEYAGELDLIVVTHAGYDVGLPGAEQSVVPKIRRAVLKTGPVKLVCAHMGGWRCWQEACDLLADTGVMIDTSFSLGSMTPAGDGYPWTEETLRRLSPEEFCGMTRLFGAERVLFGTDSPWSARDEEVKAIRALPLTDGEKSLILGENARRLLGC